MANEFTNIANVSQERNTYSENISFTDRAPTVTLRCPWEERYNVVDSIAGKEWPQGPTVASIVQPIATTFQIRGDGEPQDGKNIDTQVFDYIDALITINYQQAQRSATAGDPDGFDFFTESVEPFIEYQRVSHVGLRWNSDGRALTPEQAPAFPLYRERYRRTYFGVRLPLAAQFTSLQNHINTQPVVSPLLGVTYAPRTVLYGNRRLNYTLRTNGEQTATLSVEFTYRQETWRQFYNFETGQFDSILNESGGELAFPPEADTSAVLRV